MTKINPYLNYPDTAEEAFNFYKSIFGGEFLFVQRFKDTQESGKLSDSDKEKIMHISLPIGEGNVLMATDSLESMGHKTTLGTNFHISIETDSKQEADKIFKELSTGGKITLPISDAF